MLKKYAKKTDLSKSKHNGIESKTKLLFRLNDTFEEKKKRELSSLTTSLEN